MKINDWKQKGAGLCNPCYSYEKQFGDKTLIIRVERKSGFCDIKIKGEPKVLVSSVTSLDEAMAFCEVRFGGK